MPNFVRLNLFGLLAILLFTTGCGTDDVVLPDPDSNNSLPAENNQNSTNNNTTNNATNNNSITPPVTEFKAPEILQTGDSGILLRGTVLTRTNVMDPGEVLIQDNLITCVARDCTTAEGAANATWIETHNIISPGLIDGHNHLAYNFLPRWVPSPYRLFNNRYEWADDEAYEEFVRPYAKNRSRGTHYCPAAKWGELRSLVHATTTVQGQSFQQGCVNWGVRNVDHYHGLGHNHLRTNIASPRDITDEQAQNYIDSFLASENPITRLAVHMAEGVSGENVELEFESFAGRDTRTNRHQGISLLEHGAAVLIHSMILTEEQLGEAFYTNSKIVWSPSSNLELYGFTAPIDRILAWNIPTGIGPDWTVSGEYEMLSEMRVAHRYAKDQNIEALTPQKLWAMATHEGALVMGLEDRIGRIEPGYHADIAVFSKIHADPFQSIIDNRAQDILMVFIDGKAHFGDLNLQQAVASNEYCEGFDVCGHDKFICVQESPDADDRKNETLWDIHTQLFNILEGIGYPEDEQYGRGDELLELVECEE